MNVCKKDLLQSYTVYTTSIKISISIYTSNRLIILSFCSSYKLSIHTSFISTLIHFIFLAPKCLHENEIFQWSGYDCHTCDNFNKGVKCPMKYIPGCYCKPGFVRHNGKCIAEHSCPRCK